LLRAVLQNNVNIGLVPYNPWAANDDQMLVSCGAFFEEHILPSSIVSV